MLKLIGHILLVYYVILGAAVVVLLVWDCLDACWRMNRGRRNLPDFLAHGGCGCIGGKRRSALRARLSAARAGDPKTGDTGGRTGGARPRPDRRADEL
jgi:hypothetical protein